MQRGRSDDTSRIAERAWRGSKAVGGRWLGRPSNNQGDRTSPGHVKWSHFLRQSAKVYSAP